MMRECRTLRDGPFAGRALWCLDGPNAANAVSGARRLCQRPATIENGDYRTIKSVYSVGPPIGTAYDLLLINHGRFRTNGAPGKTRTPNLLIRSQTLYPLSYGRKKPLTANERVFVSTQIVAQRPHDLVGYANLPKSPRPGKGEALGKTAAPRHVCHNRLVLADSAKYYRAQLWHRFKKPSRRLELRFSDKDLLWFPN